MSVRSESETRCPMCERVIREDDLYEDGCPFCGTWVEEADCGCAYELVEDGAVQRKRWFHDPHCTLAEASNRHGPGGAVSWDELLTRAETEPIGLDISDYRDMWCDGFLAGQRSILEEIQAGRLPLPEAPNRQLEGSAGNNTLDRGDSRSPLASSEIGTDALPGQSAPPVTPRASGRHGQEGS